MIKKLFLPIVIFATAVAIYGTAYFWKSYGGLVRNLQPPPKDIVKLIAKNSTPLSVPDGWSGSVFAEGLGAPRVITADFNGNILVSIPAQGKVVALPDKDGDGRADKTVTVVEGLDRPHGLAFKRTDKDLLYIAESGQVAVWEYDAATMRASNKKKVVDLPGGGRHFSRTIMFMPPPNENRLLISVGSSCDVCNESDDKRAKILSVNADGSDVQTFASGLRNAVFMAAHPRSGKIWATEMGRDLLGDDLPPDEINVIEQGKNYGWPVCYGKNIHDDVFDKNTYIRNPCQEPFETPSWIDIPAHSAPLGLAFTAGPDADLLVAYHGSWNRSKPTGYKIVRYDLDAQGKYLGESDLISGWLTPDGQVLGRPADIFSAGDGTYLVSDDKAGVIYAFKSN